MALDARPLAGNDGVIKADEEVGWNAQAATSGSAIS
jgi:hypothetical protein